MFTLKVGVRVRLAPHYCRVLHIPLDSPLAQRHGTIRERDSRSAVVDWDDGTWGIFAQNTLLVSLPLPAEEPAYALSAGG